jgi:hypothetical protein
MNAANAGKHEKEQLIRSALEHRGQVATYRLRRASLSRFNHVHVHAPDTVLAGDTLFRGAAKRIEIFGRANGSETD